MPSSPAPARPRWRRAAALVQPVAAVALAVVLRQLGLIRPVPWWLLAVTFAAMALLEQDVAWRWVRRDAAAWRMWSGLSLHVIPPAVLVYAVGWGPLLGPIAMIVIARYVGWAGSRAAVPGIVLGLSASALGQFGVLAGWSHTYFPGHAGHAAAVLGASVLLVGGRAIGVEAARHERAEAELRRSEERFRALVQDSTEVTLLAGADGSIGYVSPAVERVMGFRAEDLAGTDVLGWVHPEDRPQAEHALTRALADVGQEHRVEVRAKHADGAWRWHETRMRNLLGNPAVRGIVINHKDVTARRTIQERLDYEASHDPLTGVANRSAFLRALAQAGTKAALSDRVMGVLYLDLDGLKLVNDRLGSQAGDQLLAAAGDALRRSVLGADLVGRLGADEFGVALTNLSSPDNLVRVAKRVLTELEQPVRFGGETLRPRASVGLAVSGPDCRGPMELLARADVAMYHAKRAGQHSYQMYAEGMTARDNTGEPALEDDLRRAIEQGQLRVQYQPIVELRDGTLAGFEALVRWHHPVRGFMPPLTFIPLAEATGLIVPIGAWVLEEACRQVQAWRAGTPGGRGLRLSVNLSPRQLLDEALIDTVLNILDRTGMRPGDLTLEVTESALVDYEASVPRLEMLHKHGIRVALDDFGTGYSSLRYLTRLPVNVLKLDRCFVAELNGTPEGSVLAEAVVRLGHSLHLDTVAEGIESAEQAAELGALGYRWGQGYHYSRPRDPQDIEAMLDAAGADAPVLPC